MRLPALHNADFGPNDHREGAPHCIRPAMSFELVKDVALDGVKSELARHDRGDEKKVIFTNLGFANFSIQRSA